MAFTDGSDNGRASMVTRNQHKILQHKKLQLKELNSTAVIEDFVMFTEEEFKLYSDSVCGLGLFLHIETAVLLKSKTTIFHLLTKLKQQIWKRKSEHFLCWPHSSPFHTA